MRATKYIVVHSTTHRTTPLHQKSGWKPGEPGKPWWNQTQQAFDNYQRNLKAWLSLVLPGFQGKPGYNLPWKSGNSGLYLKILTRNAWLVWYYQAFLVGLVEIFHLKSLVSLV